MPKKAKRKVYRYCGPFHDLLRLVFKGTSGGWDQLALELAASLGPGIVFKKLNLVGQGKKRASNDLATALLKRCMQANVKIPSTLAAPLLKHCDSTGVKIPPELEQELRGSAAETPGEGPKEKTQKQNKKSSIISALGLDKDTATQSIKYHAGDYLHLSLDNAENVVVSKCDLSEDQGADEAPIYTAWRKIPKLGANPDDMWVAILPRRTICIWSRAAKVQSISACRFFTSFAKITRKLSEGYGWACLTEREYSPVDAPS
jgi:hypothetical protein